MKRILLSFLLPLFSVLVLPVTAQNNGGDNNSGPNSSGNRVEDSANPNRRFWEVKMPSGNYLVALDRITSVAKHEYIISNAASRVVELTVSTSSGTVTRFYHIEPMAATAPGGGRIIQRGQELIDRAQDRTGQQVNNVVTKEYPITTHSGQVEYRVSSERAIQALHQSVVRAWKDGRGRAVTVE